eukprot:scaffold7063_cov103-Isochrysis_galbana.AAC.2
MFFHPFHTPQPNWGQHGSTRRRCCVHPASWSPGRRKYIFSRAHWRRRVTGKCLRRVTARTVALFRIFVKSACRLRSATQCAGVDVVVFIRLLEHWTSKIYVLAVATVYSPSQPYADWLCPLHADSRPIQSLGGFPRPTATQTFLQLPSTSANFPVGTFVY